MAAHSNGQAIIMQLSWLSSFFVF